MPGKAKRQGILPYVVEVTEQFGHTTARAGLPLVVETMRALGADKAIEKHIQLQQRAGGYSEVEKVEALVLLLAAGGECFDDIRALAADKGDGQLRGCGIHAGCRRPGRSPQTRLA